jgi:SAM-dependent methyltransferase
VNTVDPDLAACGFHDAECAGYQADIPLWIALADTTGGPVVDIGAGTGRVSIPLAAAGHDVIAVDVEPALLRALDSRAAEAGVTVTTVAADARALDGFPAALRGARLVAIPMQTIQLLGGADARAACFRGAADIAATDAELVISVVLDVESFDGRDASPLLLGPDVAQLDGLRFESTPLAVLQSPGGGPVDMHRRRVARDASGLALGAAEDVVITLDPVTVDGLISEAAQAGWAGGEVIDLPPTDDHAGSTILTFHRAGQRG